MCDIGERGYAEENKLRERVAASGAGVDEWRAFVRCQLLIFEHSRKEMSSGIACTHPGEKGHGIPRQSNGIRD